MARRVFAAEVGSHVDHEITLKGWARFVRTTKSTTFVVVQDSSGTIQVVGPAKLPAHVKREDALEIVGRVRRDDRAPGGHEVDLIDIKVVGVAANALPFSSGAEPDEVTQDILLEHRALSLRTDRIGTIFRVQAALVEGFRAALRRRRFTEIFSSKIVAGGTEGGANIFAIKYFDRVAYLAQSPQFYKEHGVVGLERVFETGHVYRAEPHATSRHLTEYYSLDLEMGFIEGPEDVIDLEREVLDDVFEGIRRQFGDQLSRFDVVMPPMTPVPIWTFDECLDRLRVAHGRTDLTDDFDPEAERQLCVLAADEAGVPAVFVLGYPMSARPFYTHPLGRDRAAGFDLLLRGVEVTTGGQRLHRREELEGALRGRGIDPAAFESHLRMFDLGMPPHGGLAIGAERLTAQILGLKNVREATLYPRDRYRIAP